MDEYGASGTFIPQADQSNVKIPITIGYQGGRGEKYKNKWIWAIVMLVVIIAISIGILFQTEQPLFQRILVSFLFFSFTTIILRFGYLKEGKIRNRMIMGMDNDYTISTSNFWGITRIDDEEPYICTFPNNKQGIYVKMERGVFKGDLQSAKHRHREAIGSFYKMVGDKAFGQTVLTVTHIDLMDYVGTDKRIDRAKESVAYTDNVDVRREVQGIYDDIKARANHMVFTTDIFVFQWTGNQKLYMDIIKEGLGRMMQGGGYVGYSYMDANDLQSMYRTLFNVSDFSVKKAIRESVAPANAIDIKPILVKYPNGGIQKVNYTRSEVQKMEAYNRAHAQAEKVRRRKDPDFRTTDLGVEQPHVMRKGYNGPVMADKTRDKKKDNDSDETYYSFD